VWQSMCGIAGIVNLNGDPVARIDHKLGVMNDLLAHRGPNGEGIWSNPQGQMGLAHRRLSIIDLTEAGSQPMVGPNGTVIVHNGEVYNYPELRTTLQDKWAFKSTSDTETILAAYDRFGTNCVDHLKGMFAFSLWDERENRLVAVRDRFGIKPFYYTVVGGVFYFASEAKALLPFLDSIETDNEALSQYLTFQYCLDDLTLFKGIKQLEPGHMLVVQNGNIKVSRYWDVQYEIDWGRSPDYYASRLRELLDSSVEMHLRSDVPVGGYMSGGIDSSLISILAAQSDNRSRDFFHGKFTEFPGYDESSYAEIAAQQAGGTLHTVEMTADDFLHNIQDVIYHLDYPVAGPGSFPQYMVSELASTRVRAVLGGQGGDEIFGGYARYLVAYLEQCIRAGLDDTYHNGNFVVTLESIIPNLGILSEYKPMIREFWREGLFGELDERYFRLVDRSSDMQDEVDWTQLDKGSVFDRFREIFNNSKNVGKEAYFDKMTHFDFKCLLPALLHVEDRMSMAHGLESRVPFLDHSLIEFAATVPADVKFKSGNMKHMIKESYKDALPPQIAHRRDKMGFPVPLKEWYSGDLKEFVQDTFASDATSSRSCLNLKYAADHFTDDKKFSRKTWGLLSLEIWHQLFHDKAAEWKKKAQ